MRVLVVEDDLTLAAGLVEALEREGFRVDHLGAAEPAEGAFGLTAYDLAIVDIGLPGMDGLELIRRVRRRGTLTPILILTARDALDDRVGGLDAGGDDYLLKPFLLPELLARVRALLRRSDRLESDTWQVADLLVDEGARLVRRGDDVVELTPTEFDLLAALGARRGRAVSKESLLATVWQFDSYDPNVVEVHVSALRRKLEAHGPRLVHTVRGAGYVLRP